MNIEWLAGADHLVSAALNGVYQGLIITGLVAVSLRRKRSNAATRHAAWFATLILVALLIPAHALHRKFSSPAGLSPSRDAHPAEPARETGPAPAVSNEALLFPVDPPTEQGIPSPLADDETLSARGESFSVPNPDLSAAEPDQVADLNKSESPAAAQAAAASLAAGKPGGFFRLSTLARGIGRMFNPVSFNLGLGSGGRLVSLLLLSGWCLVAGVGLAILIQRLRRIRCLKRAALRPDPGLLAIFEQLARGAKRRVELKVARGEQSPLVLGFLHPVILLPAGLAPEEAEQILRHELAHVCRRDDWANLVQHLIGAILFFHPAVWWIGRQLSLEREIACDDHVLRQSRPRTYALLLANLAGRVHGHPALLAPGASTNKSQLQQRIDMILNPNRNASPRLVKTRLGVITAVAALLATAALYAGPRLVLAQPGTDPAVASAETSAAGSAGSAAVTSAAEAPEPGAAVLAPGTVTFSSDGRAGHSLTMIAPMASPGPAPVPPTAPSIAVRPAPPSLAIAQNDLSPPRPPRPARVGAEDRSDRSVEERLDRLEKMIESLVARQGAGNKAPEFHFKGVDKPGGPLDPKQLDQIREFSKKQADFELKRMELNKQLAGQEKEAARRAVEDAKAKLKEPGRKGEVRIRLHNRIEPQLEALRRQMEALERQKESLSRQIERLEHQRLGGSEDEEIDEDSSSNENESSDAR